MKIIPALTRRGESPWCRGEVGRYHVAADATTTGEMVCLHCGALCARMISESEGASMPGDRPWHRPMEHARDAILNAEERRELEALRAQFYRTQQFFIDHWDMDRDDWAILGCRNGLLREEPYNPEKHGDMSGDAEPGDPIYFPTGLAKAPEA